MNITILNPHNNATVGWSFTVSGTYDLGTTKPPAASGDPQTTITVTVYESNGTTPLPNTSVMPNPYIVPGGFISGNWSVAVSHQANYIGAIIQATLNPSGGGSTSTSVSGININQVTPIPPIPPIPPVPPPPRA